MSMEFAFPPALSLLLNRRGGGSRSIVQIYRCPKGHLTEIPWNADEVALAIEDNDLKFHCPHCDESRIATRAETDSILVALGLPPR